MPIEPEVARLLARTCRWSTSLSGGAHAPTDEICAPPPLVRHKFSPDVGTTIHRDFRSVALSLRIDLPDTSFSALLEFPTFWALVFQGTITDNQQQAQSVADWMANFHVGGISAPEVLAGSVHKGFLSQYQLLHGELRQVLTAQNWGGKPLYLCGHSQGGALAQLTLATAQRQNWNTPIQSVYTFASPRAGDATFVGALGKELFRFEFGDDPVPHLPPDEGLLRAMGTPEIVLNILRSILGQTRYVSPGILYYSDRDELLAQAVVGPAESELNRRRVARALQFKLNHHSQSHYCRIAGSQA